jgi:hypothetical protein
MIQPTGPTRLLYFFAVVLLTVSLMGSAFLPTTALADGTPGDSDPPLENDPPIDTVGTPEAPVNDQPWDVEVALFLISVTI